MKIKRFLSLFMCIAIILTALPLSAYAQNDVQTEKTNQVIKFIDFDALEEKAENTFEKASFFGYWGIYFGLTAVLGTLALPFSPIAVIIHQINKAVSDKKSVAS